MSAVSPVVRRPDGTVWFDGATVDRKRGRTVTGRGSDSSQPDGWLSGACLMISAPLWLTVGGFAENYFLYWEDVDFSWRCSQAGASLTVVDVATAVHSVGGTHRGTGKSSVYVYYNCRNRLIFASDHLSAAERRRWARASIPYARDVVLRGGRRELLRRGIPLAWAATSGTLAGLSALLRRRTPRNAG